MKYLLLSLFAGVFSLYVHGVDNLRLPDVRSVGMGGNVVGVIIVGSIVVGMTVGSNVGA